MSRSYAKRRVLPSNCKLFSIQMPLEILEGIEVKAESLDMRRNEYIRMVLAKAANVKWSESDLPVVNNRRDYPSDEVFVQTFKRIRKQDPEVKNIDLARLAAIELDVPYGTAASRLYMLGD